MGDGAAARAGKYRVHRVQPVSTIPIGYAGLYDQHPTCHRAEFRVLLGERDFWGKGYGTEVTELLTFYGFDRLDLHRVYLGVVADNAGAVRAYEKAGFVREGVLRDEVYRNSRFYDGIRMGLLRQEYYEKYYQAHKARFGYTDKPRGLGFYACRLRFKDFPYFLQRRDLPAS